MTRDAKLFFLTYIDWEPLAQKIELHQNWNLKHDITIFNLSSFGYKHFAVISLNEMVDKLIVDHGGIEAAENDLLRTTIHSGYDSLLYGERNNLLFLKKVP